LPPVTTTASPQRILLLLALAELLCVSVWFAGTAVLPELARLWHAQFNITAWLTLAVQLGFVVGALTSAILNLSDVFSAPRLIVVSAIGAAVANALFVYAATRSITLAIGMRFLTGFAIAGVYPPGMKILSGWFREGRGFALGMMIGGLGVGSAMPHLLAAIGAITAGNWQFVVLSCSVQALIGATLVAFFIREGPYAAPLQPFDISQVAKLFQNRRLTLANFGYFGHMWELYSWWAWISIMFAGSAALTASSSGRPALSPGTLEAFSFIGMAMGGVGSLLAGRSSDRSPSDPVARIRQRSRVTIICMALSGLSCVLTAIFYRNVYATAAIALLWGLTILADSAQFSAIVSEVGDPRYMGTALTMQTAIGFLLTVISIRITAYIGQHYGWNWAAASLAIGPVVGIAAMVRLMAIADRDSR
jgi:MFS family permease